MEHMLNAMSICQRELLQTCIKAKKNIYIYFGTTVRYCLNSIVISTILKSGPESVTKNLFMPQKYLLN